jgi:hypothetical protein
MATIETDYDGLKKMALSFIQAAPTANREALDNGWKCFTLGFIGMESKRDADRTMALGLFDFVERRYCERDMELTMEEID